MAEVIRLSGHVEVLTDDAVKNLKTLDSAGAASAQKAEKNASGVAAASREMGAAGEAGGRGVASGAKQAEQSMRGAASGAKDMERAGVSAFKGIASAAAGLGVGLGVAGFFKAAISGAADLQQAVANISTIKPTIDTSGVFAALNEMQTRVPQSAKQLADSMYNIFSSIEVSQEDAIRLTEQFAKGATGAATDAATFGTAVIGVMNAYKLSVADASHISDVFFNTVSAGVVTGQELASSLGPVTQSAKAAGVSLDVLGGLIAGVTKEGGPAAENINNLNNLLQKVTTKDAQKEINALGVATVDSAGKFRPIMDILGDVKGRLAGMTEAARTNALQTIFPDAQARIGAQTILSQLDFVNKAIETNKTTTGSAAAAYEKMSATASAQMTLLKNTVSAALTEVGASVLPHLTPLITALREGIPGALAATGSAIEANRAQIDNLMDGYQLVGQSIGFAVEQFRGLPQPVQQFAAAVAATTITLYALNAVMAANPATQFAIGLGAGLTVVALLGQKLQEMTGHAQNANTASTEMQTTISRFEATALTNVKQALLGLDQQGASTAQKLEFLRATNESLNRGYLDASVKLDQYVKSHQNLQGEALAQDATFRSLTAQLYSNAASISVNEKQVELLGGKLHTSTDGAVTLVDALGKIVPAAAGAGQAASQLDPMTKALQEMFQSAEKTIKALRDLTNPPTGVELQVVAQLSAIEGGMKNLQAATVTTGKVRQDFINQSRDLITSSGLEGDALGKANKVLDDYGKGLLDGKSAVKQLDDITKPHVATLEGVRDAYGSTRKAIGDAAEADITAARGWSDNMEDRKAKVSDFVATAEAKFGDLATAIQIDGQPAGLDLVTTYGEGITDGRQVATAAMVGVVGAVKGAAAGDLSAEGLALAMGFASGITAGTGAIVGAVSRIMGAAKAQAQAELQTGSPSKVFMALGFDTATGFAMGIDDGLPLVADAGARLARAVMPSTSDVELKNLARDISSISTEAARLKAVLDDYDPESPIAKSIAQDIQVLDAWRGKLENQRGVITAMRADLELTKTAVDGFGAAMAAAAQSAAFTASFGAAGATGMQAFLGAIKENTPQSGAAFADALITVAKQAEALAIPGWEQTISDLRESALAVLANPSQAGIDAVLSIFERLGGQIAEKTKAAGTLSIASFREAAGIALASEDTKNLLGSSLASGLQGMEDAWKKGGEANIARAAQLNVDVQKELQKLPEFMRGELGAQYRTALDEFLLNPTEEGFRKYKDSIRDIHQTTELIPQGFEKLPAPIRASIQQIVADVRSGAINMEEARQRISAGLAQLPSDFAKLPPAAQAAFLALAQSALNGADVTEEAGERIREDLRKTAEEAQRMARVLAESQAAQGHAPQRSSTQGGGPNNPNTVTTEENFGGVKGLTHQHGTVDNIPFDTFNYDADILAAYGGSAAAADYDRIHKLGRFAGLARGTTNWPGGVAKVGEQGWEYAFLPEGTTVVPHAQSVKMEKVFGASVPGFAGGIGRAVSLIGKDPFSDPRMKALMARIPTAGSSQQYMDEWQDEFDSLINLITGQMPLAMIMRIATRNGTIARSWEDIITNGIFALGQNVMASTSSMLGFAGGGVKVGDGPAYLHHNERVLTPIQNRDWERRQGGEIDYDRLAEKLATKMAPAIAKGFADAGIRFEVDGKAIGDVVDRQGGRRNEIAFRGGR